MKFLHFDNVLCLSPHPDDVEYSMMASIAKFNDTTFDILCMTAGGASGFDDTNAKDRRGEVRNAWHLANLKNVRLYFSDCRSFEDKDGVKEWVNYLEKEFIDRTVYDAIFIPSYHDSMFEHKFVNELGIALVRVSPISLIEYNTPSTLLSWIPNLFINVDSYYDMKLNCLQEFKSQLHKGYFYKGVLDAFHTRFSVKKKTGGNAFEFYRIIDCHIL